MRSTHSYTSHNGGKGKSLLITQSMISRPFLCRESSAKPFFWLLQSPISQDFLWRPKKGIKSFYRFLILFFIFWTFDLGTCGWLWGFRLSLLIWWTFLGGDSVNWLYVYWKYVFDWLNLGFCFWDFLLRLFWGFIGMLCFCSC